MFTVDTKTITETYKIKVSLEELTQFAIDNNVEGAIITVENKQYLLLHDQIAMYRVFKTLADCLNIPISYGKFTLSEVIITHITETNND